MKLNNMFKKVDTVVEYHDGTAQEIGKVSRWYLWCLQRVLNSNWKPKKFVINNVVYNVYDVRAIKARLDA